MGITSSTDGITIEFGYYFLREYKGEQFSGNSHGIW